MPLPEDNYEAKLDAELRAVPLPEGLVARLRQVALADDDGLDAALRDVPLPPGLLTRLHAVVWEEDQDLDAAVATVPLPAGLEDRIRVAVLAEAAVLDEALREVPVPVSVFARLHGFLVSRERAEWWGRLATAASLLLAVSLGYFATVFIFLASLRGPRATLPTQLATTIEAGETTDSEGLLAINRWGDEDDTTPADGSAPTASPLPLPTVELFAGSPRSIFDETEAILRGRFGMPAPNLLHDLTQYIWGEGVLAARVEVDSLPELKKAAGFVQRGVSPPLVPGFPLDFYNRYRVHPFVSPAAHPKLQSVVVPLGGGTASYDLTRRYLEDHELPPPEQIRVEEFIEALDYQYPPPNKRPLALSTALGPSPFGGEGLVMLQVGVQARRPAKTPHPPMHLVLALDLSTSMNWGGRLELVKQAFGHLLEQLTAEDRISLVVFSEEAETLFEEAGADEAPQMAAVVNSLQLRSSTNIGAGLREAYAVAQRAAAETGRQTRVVLLTDGTAPADRDVFALIRNRLVESAARAVRLDVLDLGQGTEPDRQLVAFAHAGSGRHFRATTADQVRWALLESLTGKSQMVAADVRLTVSFNPRAVLAYRLLGHEGSAFTALLGERPEADFHAGQSSTALFELRLTPNNEEEVATVEVCWQPLEGGEPQRLVRKVTRKQLASSFAGSPWSLQGAVLAARTAEILRNPRIPRNTRPLLAVLELARQVDPQWHHRPCFQRFLALVEEAERIKSHRNGKAR